MLKHFRYGIVASVIVTALAGCGGEGRSGSTGVQPSAPSPESASPATSKTSTVVQDASPSSPVTPPAPPINVGDKKGGIGAPVPAQQLVTDYEKNPQAAYTKYESAQGIKRIVVEGEVKELQEWTLGAMQGVTVVFASKGKLSVHARLGLDEKIDLKPGDTVRVDGIMQGISPWAGNENKILLGNGKVLKE